MTTRFILSGGFDLLSSGHAARRVRGWLRRTHGPARPRLGILAIETDGARLEEWRARGAASGFQVELLASGAAVSSAFASLDILHIPAGHTAQLIRQLRPFAALLKEAPKGPRVVSGASGGSTCWFDFAWSASRFGEPEWLEGLGVLPGAASAHDSQPGYARPRTRPPMPVGREVYALDDDAILDWTPMTTNVIAVRPGARVRCGLPDDPAPAALSVRDLSPLAARLIRWRRALLGIPPR